MCQDEVWGTESEYDYLVVERDESGQFGKAWLAKGLDRKSALNFAAKNTSMGDDIGQRALIVPLDNASNYKFGAKTIEFDWMQEFDDTI